MTRTATRAGLLMTAMAVLVMADADAWGPRAKKTIAAMAMQVINDEYPNVFRPGGVTGANFERDVLSGAAEGYAILGPDVLLGDDKQTIQAISEQIQLLRDVRTYGPTSYFAYRMGVLGALVSDVMLPFGFAWSPTDEKIQSQVRRDIEANLDGYSFYPTKRRRFYIRDAQEYFRTNRAFYPGDKRIIAEDYLRGKGYGGFLAKGGPAYFERSVDAIADVWHSVLRLESDAAHRAASPRTITWYFVEEIAYLLNVKRNLTQADKVYENFEKANPGIAAAYDRIGDLYYAYNTPETKLRGVREWRIAYDMPDAARASISKKLSSHFLNDGKGFLERAARPGAEDTDLPNALNAFQQALEFDRTNDETANLIHKTNVAINERNQRFQTTVNIIASAEKVQAEAEKARLNGDYGNAIGTYRQAITLFEAVSDEFKEQERVSKEGARKLRGSISSVIIEVLDRASDAIDEGERAKDNHDYEVAIAAYAKVPSIVAVIPEDENPSLTADKQQIIELSERKIEEAKVAKVRYEEARREQEAAAQQRPGGAPRPGQ